jgi:hypothetical protein
MKARLILSRPLQPADKIAGLPSAAWRDGLGLLFFLLLDFLFLTAVSFGHI